MAVMQHKCLILLLLSIGYQLGRAVLTPQDEDFLGYTADRYDWSNHPCRRNCTVENANQTCPYVFVVEQYYAMSSACYDCPLNMTDCSRPHCIPADGRTKLIYTVNRQLPGPLIEVCQNDLILVDVRNRMLSDSTTIHFHGFKQRHTPYMDGVPYITQCPILPGQSFLYMFYAKDAGTFLYHSHIGNQRSNGMFGPVVVRKLMDPERMSKLYDIDSQHMIITDWTHRTGDEDFAKFYYKELTNPDNVLINGLGPSKKFHTDDGKEVYTPSAIFEVAPGLRHRIRLINAGFTDCPLVMSIDNHTMLIIALDSHDIEPVEVDALTIWPGERTDFVVKANQKPGNYWIRFNGHTMCYDNATTGVHQTAILRYKGAEAVDPEGWTGFKIQSWRDHRMLNPFNLGSEEKSSNNIDIPSLKSLDENDISLREHVDQQVYIGFNFYGIDNFDFNRKGLYGYHQVDSFGTLQFNHISLKLPTVPLLSQWDMVDPDTFCNATHLPKGRNCVTEQCACTHLIQLPLNSVVELVLVAKGPAGMEISLHPIHLHGYFYRVVAMEKLKGNVTVEQVKQLDREGKIHRNLDHPPLKDTIKTPDGGYTILRIYTSNPGFWFFHCHFDPHDNIGLALIFKVGETTDFPPKPKGFPACGNYVPHEKPQ